MTTETQKSQPHRACKVKRTVQKKTVVVTNKRRSDVMTAFMLPMVGCPISIRVENLGGLTNRNCSFSHWIVGKVEGVEHHIDRCIVRASYVDDQDHRGKIVKRNDELKYAAYGRNRPKSWYVVREDVRIAQILRRIDEGLNNDAIVKMTVANDVQPLSDHIHDNSHYVPESICCDICKDGAAEDPKKGTMLICDMCHLGFHMKCCDPPTTEMPAVNEGWYCPSCADFF